MPGKGREVLASVLPSLEMESLPFSLSNSASRSDASKISSSESGVFSDSLCNPSDIVHEMLATSKDGWWLLALQP